MSAGAFLLAPQVVSAAVLGRDGGVAPSERIVLGAIGIGNRGGYVLSCFLQEPDVRFVAVCDIKSKRREAVKKTADTKYGTSMGTRIAPPTGICANCWRAPILTPC